MKVSSRREFLAMGVGALAYASGLTTARASVAAFELEDHFERRHTHASVFAKGRVVFVGGDKRETGERLGEWFGALGGGLALYGIENLTSLPFFVPHATVRSSLRSLSPRVPVLLDFGGKVYRPVLGFPEGKECVVQVHEMTGGLLLRVEGRASAAGVAAVRRAAGAP